MRILIFLHLVLYFFTEVKKMTLYYEDLQGSIKITVVWHLHFTSEDTSPQRPS